MKLSFLLCDFLWKQKGERNHLLDLELLNEKGRVSLGLKLSMIKEELGSQEVPKRHRLK